MFFMPEFKLNAELAANAAEGDLVWCYEVEFVIEFRGSLK